MKNNSWSNTVLVAYSAIPKICDFVDFSVKNRTTFTYGAKHLQNGIETEKLFDEFFELQDKKRRLINLHIIISQCTETLPAKLKNVLQQRFCENKTYQEIADTEQCNLRTIFRRIDKAMIEFSEKMNLKGYTEEWIENEYGDMNFIKETKKRLTDEGYMTKAKCNFSNNSTF